MSGSDDNGHLNIAQLSYGNSLKLQWVKKCAEDDLTERGLCGGEI